MGLMVHSLAELPLEASRSYYVYILDYGWSEPVIEIIKKNFDQLVDAASKHDAAIIRGTAGAHFADEVLSWHHINGQPADEILPAILITTRHPKDFQIGLTEPVAASQSADSLLLIPLRKACARPQDVVPLLQSLFKDIAAKKRLANFKVALEMKQGVRGALVDALILEPTISGVGVDLKKIWQFLRTAK